jgi:twinkle protein
MGHPSNKPCPKCQELGRDKEGNNLFLSSHGDFYVCRQNGITHESYYEKAEHGEQQEKGDYMDIGQIKELPFSPLAERRLNKTTCEFYGVRVTKSPTNGEVDAHFYPITKNGSITGYKVRSLPKTFTSLGDAKGAVDLFGQSVAPQGGKRLVITGGELDCLSVFQMLKEKYPQYTPAVVSLPKGENASAIKDNLEFIKKFEEVIIYTDMDDVGRKVADDIAKLIGPRAKLMSTSEKDASDMLTKDKKAEFINAYFSASARRPEGIISGREISIERLKTKSIDGFDLQYPILSRMFGGLRKGEITTLTAGSGVGKSTMAREIGYHLRSTHHLTIGNIFLEEPLNKTIQGYIAIDNNVPLAALRKNPSLLTDEQWQDSYNRLIADKWFGLEHFGSLPTEDLMDKMRHLAYGEGCDFIILDHLSMVFSGQANDNERLAIDHAMTELAAFCNESGVGVVVVVHLSRNKSKASFNEGGSISLNDLRGSAALEQLSWNVVGLERDQQSLDKKNVSTIRVLKQRETGWTGIADTCEYNFDTGRLLPIEVTLQGDY